MSAVTAPGAAHPSGPLWTIADALALTRRTMISVRRTPDVLFFSLIQPIMFVLLFVTVFGGSVETPGGTYADYLMPGIFVQTLAFSTAVTGSAIAIDMQRGIVDRFRTLPIARSAVLAARTLADLAFNTMAVALIVVCGLLVGWRVESDPLSALGGFALLLLFGLAMSWLGVLVGLSVRAPEAASQACMVPLLPLIFLSNLFVAVETLPGWLQTPAAWNPISAIITSVRTAFGNPVIAGTDLPGRHPTLLAVIWIAGVLAVCVPLAVRKYRRL